jgi:CelD/BcsL family acetyltransferase involved in cellulose biosynthesis
VPDPSGAAESIYVKKYARRFGRGKLLDPAAVRQKMASNTDFEPPIDFAEGAGLLRSSASARPRYRTQIITDITALDPLAEDWERLRLTGRRPEVFGTLAFCRACWRAYGAGRSLCVVVTFEDARPVAILPLAVENGVLRFMTAPAADYNDILAAAAAPPELLTTVFEALRDPGLGWRRCLLENVPDDSNLAVGVAALPPPLRSRLVAVSRVNCPTLLLDRDGAVTADAICGSSRNRKLLRRLKQFGAVRLRHLDDPTEIRRHLPDFFRVHVQRWIVSGVKSPLAEPAQQRLYDALIDELGTERVRFTVLELDERPIAYHFGFAGDGKFIFYTQAFNIDHWDVSPGVALLLMLVDYARQGGLRELDCGVGDEAYKSRFSNAVRENLSFAFFRAPAHGLPDRVKVGLRARPRLWRGVKAIAAFAQQRRDRLRRSLYQRGPRATFASLGEHALRSLLAWDEVLLFAHAPEIAGVRAIATVEDLKVRPGTLSELADLASEYSDEFDGARVTYARDRLRRGDRLFLAMTGNTVVHVAWLTTGQEVQAEAELGPHCRLPTKVPVAVIEDCWTAPAWRGRSVYPAVLDTLRGIAQTTYPLVFVGCLRSNRASRRGIEKAGFKLAFRMRRLRLCHWFERTGIVAMRGDAAITSVVGNPVAPAPSVGGAPA